MSGCRRNSRALARASLPAAARARAAATAGPTRRHCGAELARHVHTSLDMTTEKIEKVEPEKKVARAFEELRKAREELKVKMSQLGKDAGDVLKDTEDLVKFIELKLSEIGEAAVKDAQSVVGFVREKIGKLAAEAEKRVTPPPAPPR
jgi:hypothetical protein